ncbi:PREDICTED: uncharacterized protein LOC109591599 [Amphimedon queenslandica]|uniref:START domain-containing protein n=1 Tax=Amphimedon queenslandica TaxID=400682 RepID=A0AAN0K0S6_AMPQE|nr:PREDICTED: uncharacterized protein LOC109591599 [Amphimedon queenslandica]|eukprot:XP_019862864.1 PREDICTED: uncharacterized protein LOC109591599 [Amphimedon queenslandica]
MNAVEKLEQMTRSNNGWILEKEENGIRCFSYRSESNSRKIWKSEVVINIAVETLWRVLYHETHRTTEWNTNVDINKVWLTVYIRNVHGSVFLLLYHSDIITAICTLVTTINCVGFCQ